MKNLFETLFDTDKHKGKVGENKIEKKLEWSNFFDYKGRLLRNVYVPAQDGKTSEIDIIFITYKGIIVIESKNYAGYIFGKEEYKNWTVTLYAGKNFWGRNKVEKHQFYNPIWQNRNHIRYLKEFLDIDAPVFSIVVFSERCKLQDVSWTSDNVSVCYRNEINKKIKKIWDSNPNVLDIDEIEEIYRELEPLSKQDRSVKQQHINDIKKFDNTEICPLCGGKLVLRTASKGINKGNQFYGCSNFPNCRYTRNI